MKRPRRQVSGDTKPVDWIGSSKQDLSAFPSEVKTRFGFALYEAQLGRKHPDAKPLKGFGGAGVIEILSRFDGQAFRAVYAVKLAGRIYVLHAFQKKSKSGVATPKADVDVVKTRLQAAIADHAEWIASNERKRK